MLTLGRDLVIIIMLLITIEQVSSHKDSKANATPTQRYCGRNLVNILVMVCDGIYNQMTVKEGLEALARAEAAQKAESSMLRKKRSIFKSQTHVRLRRGAYEDCCRLGCTIEEMTNYCGSGI